MEGELITAKIVKNCSNFINMKKNIIVYISTIFLSILYIFVLNNLFCRELKLFQKDNNVIKAKVEEILSTEVNEYQLGINDIHEEKTIYFKAKILSGKYKGKYVNAAQQINDLYAGNQKEIIIGKKVLLMKTNNFSDADYLMTEYLRSDYIIILGFVFFVILMIFGNRKGISTVISLVFTCLSIFLVFIPAVLSGHNIYLWSIITCLFIITMTLLLINGISKKTFCSMMGCFIGIFLTALLTIIMTKIMNLTGLVDEQSYYLQLIDMNKPFNLKAIIFGGIIIGAVGAIMDVAVELSASLLEIYKKAKEDEKNIKSLWKSGITIGRDMMGTMSNTLVMAYIGNSFATTLLLISYSGSLIELINREMIIVELLQILVGSFGLLLTIPGTSLICSFIYCGKKNDRCNNTGI